MSLPFDSLAGQHREVGLVVAVLLGFAFGFVLERAGFGRAPKLAAQFYFRDLTVLKVMFGAIVTAMLGVIGAAGLGLLDLRALADNAASPTYLWPMLVGGLLLGAGFIVSGYCPGTSVVAAASGNWDGAVALLGVVAGTWIYSEALALPAIARFHLSGDLGPLYLYDLLTAPPALVGAAVVVMALGMFLGGEWLEAFVARRRRVAAPPSPAGPRRFAFALMVALAVVTLAALALPSRTSAVAARTRPTLPPSELARRLIETPWEVRVLDLRPRSECAARRIPGAECVDEAQLGRLDLKEDSGARDLVLVGADDLPTVPAGAAGYPGRVYRLAGGFRGWAEYALTVPAAPAPTASPEERDAYRYRAIVHAAMIAVKPVPPPPPAAAGGEPARKKAGGGCSS